MKNNLAHLPAKNEITEILAEVKKKLNLNYSLSPHERKHIASLGESRIHFVQEIVSTVKENPQIINGCYNIEHLHEKFMSAIYFLDLSCEVEKLMMQLSDYSQLIGAEVYKDALLVRSLINTTSKLNPEYKVVSDRLNNYFPIPKKKKINKPHKSKLFKLSPLSRLGSVAEL